MSYEEITPTETFETDSYLHEDTAEQSRIAAFTESAIDRVHEAVTNVKAQRNKVAALIGATAAIGGGMVLTNEASAENSSQALSMYTTRAYSNQSKAQQLEKIYKKCGGINKTIAINVQSGMSKMRSSKGVMGNSNIDGDHAVFNWKYKKGYKLCGLVAGYNFMHVKNYTQFPKPTKNTSKSGKLIETTTYGDKSISQLDVMVTHK